MSTLGVSLDVLLHPDHPDLLLVKRDARDLVICDADELLDVILVGLAILLEQRVLAAAELARRTRELNEPDRSHRVAPLTLPLCVALPLPAYGGEGWGVFEPDR
jgi:hypothetical protein